MKVAQDLCILFYPLAKEKNKSGKMPIYARITISAQRKEFSTGMTVAANEWNQQLNRCFTSAPGLLSINNQLTQIQANLEKHYLILSTQYEYVTAELLKKSYKGELNIQQDAPKEKTICQVLNYKYSIFAKQVNRELRSGNTLNKWRSTKVKIRKFLQHSFKKWDVPLSEFKFRHADDFLNYLTLEENLEENTARKYIKNTKTLLLLAENKDWISKNPWAGYRTRYVQPERPYLEMQEVIKIYEHNFIGRLDYVRDCFLFACFTGYAFTELKTFKKSDVFFGSDQKRWIKIDRRKTGKPEGIPLLPIPASIVDKYANDPYCIKHGRLLPMRSLTHYNSYLKEIADLCGIISFELTSHLARHTFATTICLDNDVPLEMVQKLLGHQDIRTTAIYGKITRKNISRKMTELQKKLFDFNGKLILDSETIITMITEQTQKIAS